MRIPKSLRVATARRSAYEIIKEIFPRRPGTNGQLINSDTRRIENLYGLVVSVCGY